MMRLRSGSRLRFALLLNTALTSAALAQPLDASWLPGVPADFGTAARWSTNLVPDGVATFGGAGGVVTAVDLSAGLGGIVFAPGALDYSLVDARGAITGSGIANVGGGNHGIAIAPGETLTLSGAATIGPVRLTLGAGSTLAFLGNASGGTAAIQLGDDGTLSGAGVVAGSLSIGALSGGLGSTVSMGTNTLRLTSGQSIFDGQIGGTGGLRVDGGAGLTLSAAQGFTGGTTIAGGTVLLGNLGGLGADGVVFTGAAPGALRFGADGVFANDLTLDPGATGTLSAVTGRTVTVTGQIGLDSNSTMRLGSATDTGTLIIGNAVLGFALPFAVAIDGGTVRDGGIFSGFTLRAASTTVAAGATLDFNDQAFGGLTQVQALNGAGRVVTGVLGATELRVGGGNFAGSIQGAGGLRVTDVQGAVNGTLILTGNNTYAGTTTIDASHRLQLGDGGTTGNLGAGAVVNHGTLAFNRADAVTVTNDISGTGELVKDGTGTLTLAGTNTFSGATTINAGRFQISGSLTSSAILTIGDGADIGGSGRVPSTVVGAGGTISPGNSIGTLTISGNLVLAPGSIMVMEVEGATADRIDVTGTATLGGAVRLVPLGGPYSFNTPYTLLTATSITGAPSGVTTQGSFGAGVTTAVVQTPTALQLLLTPAALVSPGNTVFPGFAPYNLRATAGALDSARSAGRDLSPFFSVYNQPAATIAPAVNQLSGEVATAGAELGLMAGEQFLASMMNPFAQGREAILGSRLTPGGDGARYAVWGTATGAYRRNGGDTADGSATRRSRMAGFALGVDLRLGEASLAGAAIAVGQGRSSLTDGLGTARGDVVQAGLHGSTRLGSITLAGAAAASWMQQETERSLAFLGGERLEGDTNARIWSLRAEGRQDGVAMGALRLQPVGALQWQMVETDAYREQNVSSGNAYGLDVAANSSTTLRTELGAQLQGDARIGGREIGGFARLSWGHYLRRDHEAAVAFSAYPEAGFSVRGARRDADSALFSAGVETRLAAGLSLGMRIDSEVSASVSQVSGTARLRYAF